VCTEGQRRYFGVLRENDRGGLYKKAW